MSSSTSPPSDTGNWKRRKSRKEEERSRRRLHDKENGRGEKKKETRFQAEQEEESKDDGKKVTSREIFNPTIGDRRYNNTEVRNGRGGRGGREIRGGRGGRKFYGERVSYQEKLRRDTFSKRIADRDGWIKREEERKMKEMRERRFTGNDLHRNQIHERDREQERVKENKRRERERRRTEERKREGKFRKEGDRSKKVRERESDRRGRRDQESDRREKERREKIGERRKISTSSDNSEDLNIMGPQLIEGRDSHGSLDKTTEEEEEKTSNEETSKKPQKEVGPLLKFVREDQTNLCNHIMEIMEERIKNDRHNWFKDTNMRESSVSRISELVSRSRYNIQGDFNGIEIGEVEEIFRKLTKQGSPIYQDFVRYLDLVIIPEIVILYRMKNGDTRKEAEENFGFASFQFTEEEKEAQREGDREYYKNSTEKNKDIEELSDIPDVNHSEMEISSEEELREKNLLFINAVSERRKKRRSKKKRGKKRKLTRLEHETFKGNLSVEDKVRYEEKIKAKKEIKKRNRNKNRRRKERDNQDQTEKMADVDELLSTDDDPDVDQKDQEDVSNINGENIKYTMIIPAREQEKNERDKCKLRQTINGIVKEFSIPSSFNELMKDNMPPLTFSGKSILSYEDNRFLIQNGSRMFFVALQFEELPSSDVSDYGRPPTPYIPNADEVNKYTRIVNQNQKQQIIEESGDEGRKIEGTTYDLDDFAKLDHLIEIKLRKHPAEVYIEKTKGRKKCKRDQSITNVDFGEIQGSANAIVPRSLIFRVDKLKDFLEITENTYQKLKNFVMEFEIDQAEHKFLSLSSLIQCHTTFQRNRKNVQRFLTGTLLQLLYVCFDGNFEGNLMHRLAQPEERCLYSEQHNKLNVNFKDDFCMKLILSRVFGRLEQNSCAHAHLIKMNYKLYVERDEQEDMMNFVNGMSFVEK